MKLSQIIAYKNQLENLTPLETSPIAYEKLGPILHTIKSHDIQFANLTDKLDQDYKKTINSLEDFEQTIETLRFEVEQMIEQLEPAYYKESFRLYNYEMKNDSVEYILNRRFDLKPDVRDFIDARIKVHGDWHHAGMIIRPGHEDWIEQLVACDPLYLVDESEDLLEPAVLRFNDQYQRRLRTYIVKETVDAGMLDQLPNGQFSICLVYNFFNFKPLEIVTAYLGEIWNKLKPGGTLAMTFNDCDQAAGTDLAERKFMCYTPRRAILNAANQLGFKVRATFKIDASCTWLELEKPGQLTSIRGGQSLAKILYKYEQK